MRVSADIFTGEALFFFSPVFRLRLLCTVFLKLINALFMTVFLSHGICVIMTMGKQE